MNCRLAGSTTQKGEAFEAKVASMYEYLGFFVKRNQLISGRQVDILAQKVVSGIGHQRVVVECKYRSRGSVTNQEVYDFKYFIDSSAPANGISHGVMVCNRKFSKDAAQAADGTDRVSLMTLAELENQLFDVVTVLRSFADQYESSEICASYVRLGGLGMIPGGNANQEFKDVEKALMSWIRSNKHGGVSILADFGAGKTTLLERLKYNLAKDFVARESIVKPVFIPLRSFYKYTTLEELFNRSLINEFQLSIPMNLFWKLASDGHFLFLLDAFDEMVPQSDISTRERNFLTIAPLLSLSSKAILTCRPSYFISNAEYDNMVNAINLDAAPMSGCFSETKSNVLRSRINQFDRLKKRIVARHSEYKMLSPLDEHAVTTIHLQTFSDDQIDEYLAKYDSLFQSECGCTWQQVKNFLRSVYDLKDLMKRPILLSMIRETILSGHVDISARVQQFGPATLYELYTSSHFDIDWNKSPSRHFLSKQQRQAFTEAIALGMFKRGTLDIDYDGIVETVEENTDIMGDLFERLKFESSEKVAADIQVATFLTRVEDDLFRFVHKSFIEFFVARHIKTVLRHKKGVDSVFLTELPKEVLYFVGSFAAFDTNFKNKLMSKYRNKKIPGADRDVFRRNVAAILLYSGPAIDNLNLDKTRVNKIDVSKNTITGGTIQDTIFESVSMTDDSFRECRILRTRFTDSKLHDVSFRNCEVDLLLTRSLIQSSTFTKTDVSLYSDPGAVQEVVFDDCSLSLGGRADFERCSVGKSAINIDGSPNLALRFIRCEFAACDLMLSVSLPKKDESQTKTAVQFVECVFKQSMVVGLQTSSEGYRSLRFLESAAVVVLSDISSDAVKQQLAERKYLIESGCVVLVEKLGTLRNMNIRKRIAHELATGSSHRVCDSLPAGKRLQEWLLSSEPRQ